VAGFLCHRRAATKRRRLGRIVRRDVKAEADLLQAGATTVMRGSLAASREHHRGREPSRCDRSEGAAPAEQFGKRITGASAEAADDNMRHAARRTLPEGTSEQKRRDAPGALASEVDATDPECFFPPSNA